MLQTLLPLQKRACFCCACNSLLHKWTILPHTSNIHFLLSKLGFHKPCQALFGSICQGVDVCDKECRWRSINSRNVVVLPTKLDEHQISIQKAHQHCAGWCDQLFWWHDTKQEVCWAAWLGTVWGVRCVNIYSSTRFGPSMSALDASSSMELPWRVWHCCL